MSSCEMSSLVSIMNLPEDVGFATFFKRLYDMRSNTDVDFNLMGPDGHATFSAHKMILSLWSPIFAEEFFYGKSDKNVVNILQYTDVSKEAFEAMLKFMYGCSPSLQDHKKACELYKCANKFKVCGLQKLCRQYLNEQEVTTSNVFDILDASNFMGNKSRTDVCLKLIQEKTKEVMETFDLSGISTSMLNFFLDLPKMSLSSEFELLVWVYSWAKIKYEENNQYSNIREVLKPFLPKLHFLALSNEEFTRLCLQWPNVFTDGEIITIYMNIGIRGSKKMPDWYNENIVFRVYNNESNATAKASVEIEQKTEASDEIAQETETSDEVAEKTETLEKVAEN